MELWKAIPGFQGKYGISNKRRIRSVARRIVFSRGGVRNVAESIRKTRLNAGGVRMVDLFDGKAKVTRSVDLLMRDIWGECEQ